MQEYYWNKLKPENILNYEKQQGISTANEDDCTCKFVHNP
jgi:hypothetical protein